MGRKSIKENKSIYQLSREACNLTREEASENMFISADRIEKIENDKTIIKADEVLAMSKCYKDPMLCNHFCTHECEIGKVYTPEIKSKELSQIVLETLASLEKLNAEKNRFVEITVDGQITPDEAEDFVKIREQLSQMSIAIDSLKFWVEKAISDGRIEKDLLN